MMLEVGAPGAIRELQGKKGRIHTRYQFMIRKKGTGLVSWYQEVSHLALKVPFGFG